MTTLNHQTDEALDRMLAGLAPRPPSDEVSPAIYQTPRFTQSLDECARVEAGLTDEQRRKYFERLIWEPYDEAVHKIGWNWADMDDDDYITSLFANPRQRTIALIQTLQSTP